MMVVLNYNTNPLSWPFAVYFFIVLLRLHTEMKMLSFNVERFIILSTSMLMLFYTLCFADINATVYWECSEAENNSTDDDIAFRTSLNNLLNSLAAEGADHNGFYKTTEGKRSNRVYGLVQCRGDISASDCANCTKQSITLASHDCSQSKNVKVWFNWCFLRYSDVGFFGVWDQTSVAKANDTNFDDPSVVSGGFSMMTELATTTSRLPLMFQTAVFDAGQSGKRYGMAQCNRDISRSDCGKCLNDQLMTFRTTVGNKRGWEIYGSSCCMWYHDFQFYSNISAPSGVGRMSSPSVVETGMIVAVLGFLLRL